MYSEVLSPPGQFFSSGYMLKRVSCTSKHRVLKIKVKLFQYCIVCFILLIRSIKYRANSTIAIISIMPDQITTVLIKPSIKSSTNKHPIYIKSTINIAKQRTGNIMRFFLIDTAHIRINIVNIQLIKI